ncbi:MAG: sugar phosphate nucleotidyltransferase [Candidatus Zixiibacteriota bacterium]
MKVVIPVAGVGTRLRPHTNTIPKPLLEVAGKPILSHILDPLKKIRPSEVIFVIGYKGEQIRDFVTSNYDFKSIFVEQDCLLGLGFAVNLALTKVRKSELLIILGDTIVESDLKKFTTAGDYVLGVKSVDKPQRFGIAAIKNGYVSKLIEKPKNPPGDLALIGLYYFKNPDSLKRELNKLVKSGKKTGGEIQLTDALQGMIQNGTRFLSFEVTGWFDCGTKDATLETNKHFLKKISQKKSIDGCTLVPPVYISHSATVEQSTIGPFVSVGDSAKITDSEITNSIIGTNSRLNRSHVADSLIGQNVSVVGYKGVLNLGDNSEVVCR